METIHFGGFYYSLHSDLVEEIVEVSGAPLETVEQRYIEQYCSFLEEYIADNYDIEVTIKNPKLDNPRFYNYRTDTIEVEVSGDLYGRFAKDEDFELFLADYTKPQYGWISGYSYSEVMQDFEGCFDYHALRFITSQISDSEWMEWYFDNAYDELELAI